ncbi:Predicted arabinose efflux permease, MFS family [Nonomuraea wenchangensis]|uniref:Predicted arabinose efflux permease, MFS family n=1 Tax=Nonomuraea wenchangensis TaxID=568860 RepID=A0A1I0I0I5_9ACTN|nr:Predicted arabinose efflux permease, MFS family [Nonomuraea wenchangensis]
MSANPWNRRHPRLNRLARAAFGGISRRLTVLLGGPARFRVVAMLACVLALVSADQGTVGAVGLEIQQSMGFGNTELGSLVAVSSAAGAVAVLPVGVLTDRVNRVRLLTACIALWSLAMVAGALADSLSWLLASRVAVGALTAAATPSVVSLVGDFFPAAERGRIYGFILSGEMIGAGFGLLAGSALAHLLSWRAAFWLLALAGGAFVFVLARKLPEPERGVQSRLPEAAPDDTARRAVRRRGIEPDPAAVLRRDPVHMSLWQAIRYVLSIRTNVALIVASVVGYFFFAGVRTFAVVFVHQQYGLGQAALMGLVLLVGLGALLGVLSGGRLADHLTRRGRVSARMVVPAIAYVAAAVFFVPGLLTTSTTVALPFLFVAAASSAAAIPPLDAARLDVVHYRLWGRAESIRTFLRVGGEAIAPVLFGVLADALGPGGTTSAQGLRYAFLIMLLPLVANGVVLLRGRHAYPRDVSAAAASERMRR